MSDSTSTDQPPSHAELLALLDAPDLTARERRSLQRAARFQKRVETWEDRRSRPTPRTPVRTAVTLLLMAACLGVLALMLFVSPPA